MCSCRWLVVLKINHRIKEDLGCTPFTFVLSILKQHRGFQRNLDKKNIYPPILWGGDDSLNNSQPFPNINNSLG